ncbi:MAG: tetratricopeptide repeat protein [Planctomycetota bacterium]|nr:MAG: tetratricopeptide repeat protein [Planctomycetota bacterium]
MITLASFLLWTLPAWQQADADEQYQFLVGLYEKGLYTQVVKEGEAFLRQFPSHARTDLARYRLACALYELNQKAQAAPQFRTLTEKAGFEYLPECWFRLGQCEFEAERNDAAIAAFAKTLASNKDYLKTPARFFSGEAWFRKGEMEKAESEYAEVLKVKGQNEYIRGSQYGLVWCAFRRADYATALQRIGQYLQAYPRDAAAAEMNFLRGEALLELDRPQEALASYRSVSEGAFADAAARGAGFALAALGDPRAAAAQFASVVEKFPDSRFAAEAAMQSGIQRMKAEEYALALQAFTLPAAGDGPELLYWRAQAQAKTGDREEALAALDEALRKQPDDELSGRIHTVRGDVLYDMGRLEEAATAYARSGSDYSIHAAAAASLNAGRWEDAARQASVLLEKFPQSQYRGQAQIVLGEAMLQLKKYPEAEQGFSGALAGTDPALRARAGTRLGWCRFLQDDFAGAAARFGAVVQEFPDAAESEEAAFMLGRAQLAAADVEGDKVASAELRRAAAASWGAYLRKHPRGQWAAETALRLARLETGDAANARLAALIQTYPDSPFVPQALLLLAENLSTAKHYDQAEPRYRELLQRYPDSELVPTAQYGLAWLLHDTDRSHEAVAVLQTLLAKKKAPEPLRVRALELLVFAEEKSGNPDGALEAYQRLAGATTDEEERLRAAQTVVAALKRAGRPDHADALLASVVGSSQNPSVKARALVERTYLRLDQKDVERAEAFAREAQRVAPAEPAVSEAFFFVGEARFERNEDAQAAVLYHVAGTTEGSPVMDRALYKEGFALLRKGDAAAAAAPFETLTLNFRESELYGESLFLLGEARYRAGQYEAAVEPLSRLRSEKPRHEVLPKCLFRLGLAYGQLERWPECRDALSDLVRNFPQFENLNEAELWRGKALAAQGDERGAKLAFERVIAGDKGVLGARARLEMGRLLFGSGQTEEAMREFLFVSVRYAQEEEVAEGLYFAGLCLEKLGDSEQAKRQYREIMQKYPRAAYAASAEQRLQALGS